MLTTKNFLLLFAGVASQILGTEAASRVANEGSDQHGRTYANLIYDEDQMPWHAAHLYWHYCRYPHHERIRGTNNARYYPVIGVPRSQGLHHQQSHNAIGNVVPQGQAGYTNYVRDEKMPAFVSHAPDPANEITVFYLPRFESNIEGGLTAAAANYDFVRFSVELTGKKKTLDGTKIPIHGIDEMQQNAGKIKDSQGGGDKGLLEPMPGSSDGRGTAVARDIGSMVTIRTRRDLLSFLQARAGSKKPPKTTTTTNPKDTTPPKDTAPKDTPKDTPSKDTPKDTPSKDTPKDTPSKDTPPKDTTPKDPKPKDPKTSDTPAPSKTTGTQTKPKASNAPKEPTLKKTLPPKGECQVCKGNVCQKPKDTAPPPAKASGSTPAVASKAAPAKPKKS
ncbi:hypothetical protein B0O99DRAFT_631897 [Bisporella sp. PMI_857]|nr:hypothetical protein B0O99DRAFT_631897 [Bisporella sp. PMI_857]